MKCRCLLSLVLMTLGLAATGYSAYLPAIGPGPLRFHSPPQSATRRLSVPLVNAAAVTESVSNSIPVVLANVPSPPDTNVVETEITAPAAELANSPTNAPPLPSLDEEIAMLNNLNPTNRVTPGNEPAASVVTPQMIMPFFTEQLEGTNRFRAGVFGTLRFVPPTPRPPPSSKAVLIPP